MHSAAQRFCFRVWYGSQPLPDFVYLFQGGDACLVECSYNEQLNNTTQSSAHLPMHENIDKVLAAHSQQC